METMLLHVNMRSKLLNCVVTCSLTMYRIPGMVKNNYLRRILGHLNHV